MDPDAALTEMRELAQSDLSEFNEDIHRLAELFIGLDEWLSKGGFLPVDWRFSGTRLSDIASGKS